MESDKFYTFDEVYNASLTYFGGDETAAKAWMEGAPQRHRGEAPDAGVRRGAIPEQQGEMGGVRRTA